MLPTPRRRSGMKRPLYEQEQARKVKTRFRMLQHAQKISHNVSQTCRFCGISRAQSISWLRRFEKNGMEGLRDRSRRPSMIRYRIPPEVIALILRIREERRYGAVRLSLYLRLTDNHPEDLPPSSRRPRLAKALPTRAQASSRRTASGSGPVGPSRCEVPPPAGPSSPALLPVHSH